MPSSLFKCVRLTVRPVLSDESTIVYSNDCSSALNSWEDRSVLRTAVGAAGSGGRGAAARQSQNWTGLVCLAGNGKWVIKQRPLLTGYWPWANIWFRLSVTSAGLALCRRLHNTVSARTSPGPSTNRPRPAGVTSLSQLTNESTQSSRQYSIYCSSLINKVWVHALWTEYFWELFLSVGPNVTS